MGFSRQTLLGVGMVVGGLVMLSAMVQQLGNRDEQSITPVIMHKSDAENPLSTPLTLDIDTEKRILAQKEKERAARVAEQDRQAKEFSKQRSDAEANALAKARIENQLYVTKSRSENSNETAKKSSSPTVNQKDTPTVIVQADNKTQKSDSIEDKKSPPKAAIDYKIESGDGLLKLAKQYNVPLSALAQANNLDTSDVLQIGQALTIPSRKQVERLEREAAAAKKAAKAKKVAQQKLNAAREDAKKIDAKGTFGVQVALAINQDEADKLAEKFKAAGYDVKTSQTSRGVRVVVGPERGKVAALALKDHVNSNSDVAITNAWVLYW